MGEKDDDGIWLQPASEGEDDPHDPRLFRRRFISDEERREPERRPSDGIISQDSFIEHRVARRALVGLAFVKSTGEGRLEFDDSYPLANKGGRYQQASLEFVRIRHKDGIPRFALVGEAFHKGYEGVGLHGSEVVDQDNMTDGVLATDQQTNLVKWSVTPTNELCARLSVKIDTSQNLKSNIRVTIWRGTTATGISQVCEPMFIKPEDIRGMTVFHLFPNITFEAGATYTFQMESEDGSKFYYRDPNAAFTPAYTLYTFEPGLTASAKPDMIRGEGTPTVTYVNTKTASRILSISFYEHGVTLTPATRALFLENLQIPESDDDPLSEGVIVDQEMDTPFMTRNSTKNVYAVVTLALDDGAVVSSATTAIAVAQNFQFKRLRVIRSSAPSGGNIVDSYAISIAGEEGVLAVP